jgi:hypothetical protein
MVVALFELETHLPNIGSQPHTHNNDIDNDNDNEVPSSIYLTSYNHYRAFQTHNRFVFRWFVSVQNQTIASIKKGKQ